ncbi:hypothetical protein Achl_4282 (plasmid) [Pseudarthrobacter chlorophenolicus A6]|uniref:Uncharacterized protein n=1 Tax=Pseudarthrobacter chlorophenolicus (strain ATCC 700700 / DSM 12829 / CIP 107037 / JCM 12360 / KCTC 9906 / NCIMB 13794 / A6) TaxID=452863 RepID=B8HII6_PSECP|nr:hypothetical protein [Pseudarthrobacter chlorophenolicus]ACL42233.1 hypothetical protein Achl_4282 [Pseudarthrobacter chlorophenolicus A6]SDQ15242.1 hypothetical protein SAMN04489738_0340 [Pseudarthrobacter chlorophenolicus]
MPIRQHPLLRHYAKALGHISMQSLAGPDFPPVRDVMENFDMALAAMPPLPPGEDRRHDEIRRALKLVASGGDPARGPFNTLARWAAGWLADYTAALATMGTEIAAQVVPGSLLHYFSDGLNDQEKYGLGHRRVLKVSDFSITFEVADGEHAGTVVHYTNGDPESLAPYLIPAEDCGPDCHRGQ